MPPTPPSSSSPRKRTRSDAQPHAGTSSPSSPARLLVKLNGRVYRPPSPDDLRTRAEQEADLLLQEPHETTDDLAQSRRDHKRKQIEIEMRRERLRLAAAAAPSRGSAAASTSTPPRSAGRLLRFDSDDGLDRAVTPPPLHRPMPASVASPLGLPFAFQTDATTTMTSPKRNNTRPLPPHLAALLSLHAAVERTLILHLSTAGSTIASTVSDTSTTDDGAATATVRMTNLIDLSTLGKMLASTGKRFTETELRRLVWVWQGAGASYTPPSSSSSSSPARKSPTDSSSSAMSGSIVLGRDSEDEVGGMGFLVTRARTASSSAASAANNGSSSLFNASGARVSSTYGIGITVAVRSNPQLPKLELVSPGRKGSIPTPPSPSSVGKGRDGMSIVALWTQGKEQRQREVERRLRAWADKQVKLEPGVDEDVFGSAPTVPSIPLAALPLLSPAVPAVPSTTTPSPCKSTAMIDSHAAGSRAEAAAAASDPVVSPQKFVETLLAGKPVKSKAGKAAERERALRARIEAKQAAQQKSAYHASLSALSTGGSSPTKRSLKRHGAASDADDAQSAHAAGGSDGLVTLQEVRKQNAMLSRLGSVADVVAMRCQGRPILYEEVCTAVANSPLVSIGYDEADHALSFLAEHFPDFVYVKTVGNEPWLSLRGVQRAIEVKQLVQQQLVRAGAALENV
ncbi:hypothetical protein B0A53_01298 [Rhodotorula sp. CCFEE 5036]|nr:hypothetical protein B0A53_01298 [Rhodotorula sp. CCFEE 5036]